MNTFVAFVFSIAFSTLALLAQFNPMAASPLSDSLQLESVKQQRLSVQESIGIAIANPQGEYRNAVQEGGLGNWFGGLNFYALYNIEESLFHIGGEAGFLIASTDEGRFDPDSTRFTSLVAQADRNYQISLVGVPINALIRFQTPARSPVFAFWEGSLGATVFVSSVSRTGDVDGGCVRTSVWGNLQYGIGVGAGVKLVDIITLPSELQRVLFEAKVRYESHTAATQTTYRTTAKGDLYQQTLARPQAQLITFTMAIAIQL
jgi:hypothetical protein